MEETDLQRQDAIEAILSAHAGLPGPLLPILHAVQDCARLHPARTSRPHRPGAQPVARRSARRHQLLPLLPRSTPPGRHVLQVCRAEACQADARCEALEAHAKQRLGVDFTARRPATARSRWSRSTASATAPARPSVMIDEHLYGRVTPERLDALIDDWAQALMADHASTCPAMPRPMSLGADETALALRAAALSRGIELKLDAQRIARHVLARAAASRSRTRTDAHRLRTGDGRSRRGARPRRDCSRPAPHALRLGRVEDLPYFARQQRLTFARVGVIDPVQRRRIRRARRLPGPAARAHALGSRRSSRK